MSSISSLPETVKTAKAKGIQTVAGAAYFEIPILPGKDEVAMLLATNWQQYNTQANGHYAIIWRKSRPKTASVSLFGDGFYSDDVLDYQILVDTQATAVGLWRSSKSSMVIYPYPMPLIRPPQLVISNGVVGAGVSIIICYYVIQKVSKSEMARLMMKDHD